MAVYKEDWFGRQGHDTRLVFLSILILFFHCFFSFVVRLILLIYSIRWTFSLSLLFVLTIAPSSSYLASGLPNLPTSFSFSSRDTFFDIISALCAISTSSYHPSFTLHPYIYIHTLQTVDRSHKTTTTTTIQCRSS
jgi:hypothetical protein